MATESLISLRPHNTPFVTEDDIPLTDLKFNFAGSKKPNIDRNVFNGDVTLRPYNAPYIKEDDIPLTNLTFSSTQPENNLTTKGGDNLEGRCVSENIVETDELSDNSDFEFLYQVMKKKHIGNYETAKQASVDVFVELHNDPSIEAVEFSQTFTLKNDRFRFRLKNDGNSSNMLKGIGYADVLTGVECSVPFHLEIYSKAFKSKKLVLFHDSILGCRVDVVFDTDDIPSDISVTTHMSILSTKIRDDIRYAMDSLKWNGIIYK